MGTTVETETYKGYEIEIKYDENPENCRTDWDNFTEIHCCSTRHYLGEHNHKDWDECRAAIREAKKRGDLVFKVYAYIHSGVVLSLESFYGHLPQGHAEFDSGQSGFMVVRKKDIIENWGKSNWTEKLRKKAYEVALSDIKTFNSWVNGEVYGYDVDDGEESCYGYYEVEYALQEAKSIIDWIVEKQIKDHCEELKKHIKSGVPLQYRKSLQLEA